MNERCISPKVLPTARSEEYTDSLARLFHKAGFGVTFQVTEDCCMACTYCYQKHNTVYAMNFDVAKRFIDQLLAGEIGQFNTDKYQGFAIDFIGGEPLLKIELIEQIVDYLFERLVDLDHPWAPYVRLSLCSNGLLYFSEPVQHYLKKYGFLTSFCISIDGNKELHDSCRVDLEGKGTYDRAMAAVHKYHETFGVMPGIKMTLFPTNLPYLYKSIINLIDEGYKMIHLNCVYENVWSEKDATLLYEELKKAADYIADHDLQNEINLAIIDSMTLSEIDTDQNWCGGVADTCLALDALGQIAPCIRYFDNSLKHRQPAIIIGSVEDGYLMTEEHKANYAKITGITRSSQSTQECLDCPISGGCGWCFPAGTKINTPSGLRNIEDLHIYDNVIDMNGDIQMITTNTGHLANDLVTVRATGLMPITVTSEHPFYCRPVVKRIANRPVYDDPQWIAAKDLKVSDRIALFVPKLGDKDINKTFAYVIGRYIGDGWKTKSDRIAHPYRYYICTAFDEQEEFESYLNQSGIKYSKTKNRTVEEYHLNITDNEYMVELLNDCGENAKTKHIPREVWSWNKKSVAALLKGYFDADGSIDKNTQRFCSVSHELILNVCELVRAVYHKAPNITFRKSPGKTVIEGRTVNNSDSYEGRFLLTEPTRHFYEYDEENNIIWTNIRSGPEAPSELYVYNLTVENTHSYIANGAIVHNCSAYNYEETGSVNKRVTYICIMHKARSLATYYYFKRMYAHVGLGQFPYKIALPREECLKIISPEEYDFLQEGNFNDNGT